MAETIHLEIIIPERVVFESDVDRVDVPGLDGYLGILPGHTEMVSGLKPAGILTYYVGEERGEIAVTGGIVEVNPNRVVILANQAARPDDIDVTSALKQKERAEKDLQKALQDPDADWRIPMVEIDRANVEIQIAQKH